MNNIIKYGSIQAIPLYNCSAHTPEEWTLQDGVRRPILGISEAICGLLIDIIYIPMLIVMLEKKQFKMSCYKIMAFLAIVDIFSIIIDCVITGFLAYQGAVFCSYPNLIYFSGIAGEGLWCCSCLVALILVCNRLCDFVFPKVGMILFAGNRVFLILFGSVLYSLFFVFNEPPVLFTSKYHAWFFDPMIFEGRGAEYGNLPAIFNNYMVVVCTCSLYLVFCIVLGVKVKDVSTDSETRKVSIQIFFQSAMICAVNLITSIIYVTMNYIDVPFWLIILAQFMWQVGNAAPIFVYLQLNKTIRNGVLYKIGWKRNSKINTARRLTKSNI